MEVPIPYIRPIFQALISGNIPTKYGQKYGTVPPFQDPEIPIDLSIAQENESSLKKELSELMDKMAQELGPSWVPEKPRVELQRGLFGWLGSLEVDYDML